MVLSSTSRKGAQLMALLQGMRAQSNDSSTCTLRGSFNRFCTCLKLCDPLTAPTEEVCFSLAVIKIRIPNGISGVCLVTYAFLF